VSAAKNKLILLFLLNACLQIICENMLHRNTCIQWLPW
jgi:hypothetical protein